MYEHYISMCSWLLRHFLQRMYLPPSLSLCVYLSCCLSVCLSPPLSLPFSLSLSPLFPSLKSSSPTLSTSLYLYPLSYSQYLNFSIFPQAHPSCFAFYLLILSLYLSLSLCLPLSLSHPLSIPLSLSLSLSISPSLSPSFSDYKNLKSHVFTTLF